MKTAKKILNITLILTLFLGVPSVFLSCSSSSDAVMIGVLQQNLKKSHKIGGYKVRSVKEKPAKKKKGN